MPKRCDCCGDHRLTLREVFVNDRGWRHYCAPCCNPDSGLPRPCLGPYPITRHRKPLLAVAAGNPRP